MRLNVIYIYNVTFQNTVKTGKRTSAVNRQSC